MDNFWVTVQGLLVGAVGVFAMVATGTKSGFPMAIVAATGMLMTAGLVAWHFARTPKRWRRVWRRQANQGLLVAALAFGLPLAAGVVAWRSPGLDGLLFSSDAAAFAAVCIGIIPTAALVSSMADRFVILPRVLGLRGTPIWRRPNTLDEQWRRRLAQAWIVHRGLSELVIFPAIALVLAIVLVAVGNAFAADDTLPTAIESLGGAGIAFVVFGFRGPRWRGSLEFVLSGPVPLGTWVEGTRQHSKPVEGLVVDVSVHPGVKVVAKDGERVFVPLELTSELHPAHRPAGIDDRWCRDQVLTHVLKLDKPSKWRGP